MIFNTPLFSTFLILCLGISFLIQQRQLINKLDAIAGNPQQETKAPPSASENRPPSPNNIIVSSTPQRDPLLLQTISQLYAGDRKVRINAISKLSQDKQSHEMIVPLAIEYALTHPGDNNGIGNTLVILQKCDPSILRRNKDQVARFIEMIRTNNSQLKPDAERLGALIK